MISWHPWNVPLDINYTWEQLYSVQKVPFWRQFHEVVPKKLVVWTLNPILPNKTYTHNSGNCDISSVLTFMFSLKIISMWLPHPSPHPPDILFLRWCCNKHYLFTRRSHVMFLFCCFYCFCSFHQQRSESFITLAI